MTTRTSLLLALALLLQPRTAQAAPAEVEQAVDAVLPLYRWFHQHPVREETGLPYASQSAGVMHACGHDLHMSAAVGTLRLLARSAKTWAGTVLFIGQPAEETGDGARAMLKDKALQMVLRDLGKPKVALAFHDAADMPAGVVGIKGGLITANVAGTWAPDAQGALRTAILSALTAIQEALKP